MDTNRGSQSNFIVVGLHRIGFPISVKPDIFSEVEVTYILVGMMSFMDACVWRKAKSILPIDTLIHLPR